MQNSTKYILIGCTVIAVAALLLDGKATEKILEKAIEEIKTVADTVEEKVEEIVGEVSETVQ